MMATRLAFNKDKQHDAFLDDCDCRFSSLLPPSSAHVESLAGGAFSFFFSLRPALTHRLATAIKAIHTHIVDGLATSSMGTYIQENRNDPRPPDRL
jgi:hypothetical protein